MTAPRTTAGRALLANIKSGVSALFAFDTTEDDDANRDAILAIEAEAAEQERQQRLAAEAALDTLREAVGRRLRAGPDDLVESMRALERAYDAALRPAAGEGGE